LDDGGRRRILLGHVHRATAKVERATCTLSDRGTWISFKNKGALGITIEGVGRLINRYDVILLNPAKHPVPKQAAARRFAQWLVSPEGQAAIGAYQMEGEQLFHPSAARPK
jgi:tungstate transport system substrate-binding protein